MNTAKIATIIVGAVASILFGSAAALALEFGEPTQIALGEEPWAMDAGLLVGDGRTDVVVGTIGGPLMVLEGTEYGAGLSLVWSFPGSYPKAQVAVGDFDGDGDHDIAAAYEVFEGDSVIVFTQEMDGTFQESQRFLESVLEDLTVADLDKDGDDDLLGAAPNSVVVHLGGPDLFGERVSYPADIDESCTFNSFPTGFAVGDVTDDGHLDITFTAFSSNCEPRITGVGLLAGGGGGAFDPVEWVHVDSMYAWRFLSVGVADVNSDEIPDIVVSAADSVHCLFGNDGVWIPGPSYFPDKTSRRFLLRDFDGDSDVDIVGGWSRWLTRADGAGDGTFQPEDAIDAGMADVQLLQLDLDGGEGVAGWDSDGFVTVSRNLSYLDPATVSPADQMAAAFSVSVQSPARGGIRLAIESLHAAWLDFRFYDVSGRVLHRDRVWTEKGSNSFDVEADLGVTGIKLLRVDDPSGFAASRKFLWSSE